MDKGLQEELRNIRLELKEIGAKLTKVVVLEEKFNTQREAQHRIGYQVRDLDERVRKMEISHSEEHATVRMNHAKLQSYGRVVERMMIWLLGTSVVGYIGYVKLVAAQ